MSKIGSSFGSGFFFGTFLNSRIQIRYLTTRIHNPFEKELKFNFFLGLKEHNTCANESGQVCAKKQFAIIFPACHFPLDPSSIKARCIIDQSSIDQLAADQQ